MDENDDLLEELGKAVAPTPATTLKKRLIIFAFCHIILSYVFLAVLIMIIPLVTTSLAPSIDGTSGIPLPPIAALTALGMALYFPLGMLAAKRGHWTVPTRREQFLSIARPFGALISWIPLLLLISVGTWDFSGKALLLHLIISAFLAAPSGCLTVCLYPFVHALGMPGFLLAALLSALLPPLLFGLGSFWQTKRQNSSPPT